MIRLLVVLSLLAPGCTAVGASTGAGIVQWHNVVADDEDDWSYVAPVLIGATLGLVIDLMMVRASGKRFGTFGAP